MRVGRTQLLVIHTARTHGSALDDDRHDVLITDHDLGHGGFSMTLDRDTVLSGIASELHEFGELVAGLSAEDLTATTRCEGWAVGDVAGHVIGTVVDVTEGRLEGQGTPAVTRRQASERAGHSGGQLSTELADAVPKLTAVLQSLPPDMWEGPALTNPEYTLGFAVEAIWYDAFVHGNDIRDALGQPPTRGAGLRCAVHHVAGYLDHHRWRSVTLALEGMDRIDIAGGGPDVSGDPLDFVLVATGRLDPASIGLDSTVNVYAESSETTGV